MKTMDDADVKEFLEEAEEDLADAGSLVRRPGGAPMAMYHAAQAAEKYLRGLGEAVGRKANPMWDLERVYETVKDQSGLGEVQAAVAVLAVHGTPGKTTAAPGATGDSLRAVRAIRRAVLVTFGMDLPPEPEFVPTAAVPAPVPQAAPAANEDALENGPPAGYVNAPPPGYDDGPTFPHGEPTPPVEHRPPPPSARGDGERRTSYVKMFLICETCGVRLPRTRQTATGRVPCPHCNRPMRLVS